MRVAVPLMFLLVCLIVAQPAVAQSSIDIRKQEEGPDVGFPVPPGDVSFDIVVTNNGDSPLTGVTVTDVLTPNCDQFIGDLGVGDGMAYTCVAPSVSSGFVNQACVVGTGSDECFCPRTPGYWKNHTEAWPVDELVLGGVAYGADALLVFLEHKEKDEFASLKLARHLTAVLLNLASGSDPAIQPVVDQANAFLAIHPPGSDPQGADESLALAIKDQLDAYDNEVDCDDTETVQCDVTVTDCDTSEVVIDAGTPSIDIRKQEEGDDIQTVFPDFAVSWEIEVTNNGDFVLENVSVSDPLAPDCIRNIGTLGVGDSFAYNCTLQPPLLDFTNRACASGDGDGTPVSDCDDSTVEIIVR